MELNQLADTLDSIRLVATDLDGTLLNESREVSERSATAIAKARAKGIHVIPVTGRPPLGLWPVLDQASLGPLGVCSNGSIIVDTESRSIVEVEYIDHAVAANAVGLIKELLPNTCFAVDEVHSFTYETAFLHNTIEPFDFDDWGDKAREVDDIRSVVGISGCLQIAFRSPGTPSQDVVKSLANQLGDECELTASILDWVNISAASITKAVALERVTQALDIHPSQVVAIGDHFNDLPMLAWAGLALAPSNATNEILEVVDHILPTNVDHGVAQFLEALARL